jgi:glucose-1-phosphate cytidylyltransferase
MKVVLLAGGRGSRLSEETQSRPKPMVEIGGHPILWHIMMMYWSHGFRDFIICLGYRGYFIKEYRKQISSTTYHKVGHQIVL